MVLCSVLARTLELNCENGVADFCILSVCSTKHLCFLSFCRVLNLASDKQSFTFFHVIMRSHEPKYAPVYPEQPPVCILNIKDLMWKTCCCSSITEKIIYAEETQLFPRNYP